MSVGGWTGHRQTMEGVYLDQLQLDDYLLADYVNDTGQSVNVYMSWYNSQRKGEAVHSPRACLPGGGWQLRDFDQRALNVKIDGRPLRVNRTLIELGDQRQWWCTTGSSSVAGSSPTNLSSSGTCSGTRSPVTAPMAPWFA